MSRPSLPHPARTGLSIGWSLLLVAPLMLLTLPVTLPIVAFFDWRDRRRRRAMARVTPCGRCGAVLGEAALQRADAAWAAHVARLCREHPGMRWRLHRTMHALCGVCGTGHRWMERERRFVPLPDEDTLSPDG